jgi:hypothetical protein
MKMVVDQIQILINFLSKSAITKIMYCLLYAQLLYQDHNWDFNSGVGILTLEVAYNNF